MGQKRGFHMVVQIVLKSSKSSTRCARRFVKKVSMNFFFFQASLRNCINCVHCDDHFFIFSILLLSVIMNSATFVTDYFIFAKMERITKLLDKNVFQLR